MKFFFIGLALPNEKFWVNLRPDSPDNILDPLLEKTDIGRIFLEADVQLKKDTAAMTSPQTKEGKEYWDKLYKKAGELFGTEHIAIPTITRPWIVPNEIIIREAPDNAYIYKATLKVMLEEDYLKSPSHQVTKSPVNQAEYSFKDPRLKELNEYSTQLIKETIIPKLTYEVNTSKRYAPLRQVYYSLILAQWFKQKYKGLSPKGTVPNRIDSGDLTNLTSKEPYDKQSYFQQYQKSFKDGEYNLQEPVSTTMGQSIRRYVSGGMQIDCSSAIETGKITAGSSIKTSGNKAFYLSEANFSSSSMRPSRSSSAMENRDSQVPHHWDTQWKLPSQKAIDAADAFKEFFKNELLSDKKILDGDMSRIYELFIEDEAGNYIDNGGNYEIRPAAEVLKALYLRYPKLAAAIIGSIRTRNHHIFWCLALESLEVSLFQKLIDEAVSMNLKNEAISVGGVEYLPDYAGFDLAGALLLMIEDMFKERLSILSEAGQSFIIDYAFDFLAARWRGGGRLNEKNVLKVLNLLLVKNPGLYHRLSDRIVKLLKSPSQGNPLNTIAINPVSIEDVMSEDVFKEINSLKPFKIDAMPDYLSFLERLIQSAYDDIYNIEHMRNLTVAITKVRHYWKEGGYYDFALDQWRDTENIIISIKNDGDDKRRKAAVESKKVFLIEYFMKQLNKLWADFLFQRGIVVSPLAIGRTVGKLRVITDAVAKDPDFWLGLKEDEIVVVADFPPNVSLINPPRGVINTLASGITSHASVRAKKWGIPCAGLYGISMDMLANLNGQWAVLEALFPKGVLRRVSEAEIANYSRPARVFEKIKVGPANLSNESPDVITEYTQGIEQFLGFKAVNQLFLQDKEIGAKLPRSVGVTYKRFKDILALPENAKSKDEINALLKNIDRTNNTAIRESLGKIRGLILSLKVTKNIEGVVMSSIGKHIPDANKLMVRLATNADDLPDHPGVGAGTYGSYICEQREPQIVVNAILNAYASLFSYDAFIEREVYDIYHNEVFPSILIQEFVPADYSFGIHTVHPVSGDKNKMLIEIVQGLGPGLRDKLCPGLPYQSIYDKERKEIIEVVPATKTTKVVYLPDGLGGFPITAAADYVRDVFLGIQGPAIAKRIAEIGILIERLIREGQDIEGAIVMRNGRPELYIVQSRAQILSFASSAVEGFKTENNGTDAFVIGGKNSNESIDRLGKLNGIPIEEIEGNARSGRYSSAGFIGRNQSLKEVLKADNTFVSSKGFTHQELAAPLLQIIGLMDKKTM